LSSLSSSAALLLYCPVEAPWRPVRSNLSSATGPAAARSSARTESPSASDAEREANRGEALSQTIVCASASYRLDIQIYVEASGQTVQGYWRETTRNVSGQLTGRIQGGLFEGAVMGQGFTAGISLRSNGRRQTVNIAPSGGDIANVRIELERRG